MEITINLNEEFSHPEVTEVEEIIQRAAEITLPSYRQLVVIERHKQGASVERIKEEVGAFNMRDLYEEYMFFTTMYRDNGGDK